MPWLHSQLTSLTVILPVWTATSHTHTHILMYTHASVHPHTQTASSQATSAPLLNHHLCRTGRHQETPPDDLTAPAPGANATQWRMCVCPVGDSSLPSSTLNTRRLDFLQETHSKEQLMKYILSFISVRHTPCS